MSVEFFDGGDFARIDVNGQRMVLDDDQVTRLWCQTAGLHDNSHSGPARVILGERMVNLTESQWHALYLASDDFMNKAFWADMMEEKVLH